MATVSEKLTALANAIRSKSGVTGQLSLDAMKTAVDGIQVGSGGSGGEGTSGSIVTIGDIGDPWSDSPATIIYTYINAEGNLDTFIEDFMYMAVLRGYMGWIEPTTVVDTPIIVLSSDEVAMPTSPSYYLHTLARGTGYTVYKYTNPYITDPEEGDIPDEPGGDFEDW